MFLTPQLHLQGQRLSLHLLGLLYLAQIEQVGGEIVIGIGDRRMFLAVDRQLHRQRLALHCGCVGKLLFIP